MDILSYMAILILAIDKHHPTSPIAMVTHTTLSIISELIDETYENIIPSKDINPINIVEPFLK